MGRDVLAPKSVSLTALVGGDERVREAHRESVGVALDEMEQYVQARIGGNLPPETTGKWVAAKFEHDSARPVDGYAAPQLHTHVVFFNLTETEIATPGDSATGTLQDAAVCDGSYRSELAHRLKELATKSSAARAQPEIKGYSKEYLEASVRAGSRSKTTSSKRGGAAPGRRRSPPPHARRQDGARARRDGTAPWLAGGLGTKRSM